MNITHLNLVVDDVAATTDFFETYFGFRRTVVRGESVIAVLENAAGFVLVLMSDKGSEIRYPKNFHFGVILDQAAAVDGLYNRLVAGGIDAGQPPRTIRNSHAFYLNYDKLFIEVAHYYQAGV